MKKAATTRRYSREFKVAAVARVTQGEAITAVARELEIGADTLWRWRKIILEKGEEHLHGVGRPRGRPRRQPVKTENLRMAELERLVGRQQMEIRFLDRALRRIEEQRQEKRDGGEAASSKR
jgi:transposase-like protein